MFEKLMRAVKAMELEEQILHVALIGSILGVFLPWFGGQWFGKEQMWNGFGFYTAYLGFSVFALQVFMLVMTISPLVGGPVLVRRQQRNYVRFALCCICMILLAAAFTVLLRVTFDVSGAEIRWGIYISMVGSAVALLYSFMRHQQFLRSQVKEVFQHPDELRTPVKRDAPAQEDNMPPPPPPPPPMPPEDHNLFTPKE